MEYAKRLIDYLNVQIYEAYKNGMSTNEIMEEHDLPYFRVMDAIRKGKVEENKGMDNIQELTEKIEQWAIDRNLHTADPKSQAIKLFEELGELAEGLSKNKQELIEDAIGDSYVVLTILAMQLDLDINKCIETAYNEIKNRKGKMVNGVFVKESDL